MDLIEQVEATRFHSVFTDSNLFLASQNTKLFNTIVSSVRFVLFYYFMSQTKNSFQFSHSKIHFIWNDCLLIQTTAAFQHKFVLSSWNNVSFILAQILSVFLILIFLLHPLYTLKVHDISKLPMFFIFIFFLIRCVIFFHHNFSVMNCLTLVPFLIIMTAERHVYSTHQLTPFLLAIEAAIVQQPNSDFWPKLVFVHYSLFFNGFSFLKTWILTDQLLRLCQHWAFWDIGVKQNGRQNTRFWQILLWR